ncbi:hypothetical protein NC651_040056 [Populus alba x Populus x berolinensis]|nr:hypothetical protein NC651_040056 [Populus alba x Populus x berolinensis]
MKRTTYQETKRTNCSYNIQICCLDIKEAAKRGRFGATPGRKAKQTSTDIQIRSKTKIIPSCLFLSETKDQPWTRHRTAFDNLTIREPRHSLH